MDIFLNYKMFGKEIFR